MQQEQSKDSILEGYLNTIYFGRGAYGVQAASLAYFDKPAKRLDVAESAMLAAILNSPNYLNPKPGTPGHQALIDRYDYVLDGMVTMGNLDPDRRDRLRGKLPALRKAPTNNQYGGQRGFMLSMVKSELRSLGFDSNEIDSGGLRVETTFTPKGMRASEDAVPASGRGPGQAARRHGLDRRAHRCPDRLLRRAELPQEPARLGHPRRLAGVGVQAVRPRGRAQGRVQPEVDLRRQLAFYFDNGSKIVNEGPGDGNDYGSAISLLTATEQSVNTAYSDLTQALGSDGPRQILDTAVKIGVPRKTPAWSPTTRSRSARPRSARSRWPTPTRPSPTVGATTTCSPSRRSPARPTARCSTGPRARPTAR